MSLLRAQQLFDARQFREARTAYESLRVVAGPQDRDIVELRLAQCDATEAVVDGQFEFHAALARACHNPVLVILIDALFAVMFSDVGIFR